MQIPFIGGAYEGYSKDVNTQQCLNLFPAIDQGGKNPIALYNTPGLSLLTNDTQTGPVRGSYVFKDYLYAVILDGLYAINSTGVVVPVGSVSTTTGDVYFADNGTEMIVVDGTTQGYLVTGPTNPQLTAITDTDFPTASSVTFQDGYFIVTDSVTGAIYVSALYDGSSWNALDFASGEADPDNTTRVISDTHNLWVFGGKSVEVFYNSGDVDFPFTRVPGAILDIGLAADASALKVSGNLYWFSTDGHIVRNNGYQFTVVSPPSINYQIAKYSKTSDARAFSYQTIGHVFYCISFPSANKTWVYDVTTNFWHEWESYTDTVNPTDNWGRHRANCVSKFGDKYIAGDYETGDLYEIDINTYSDYNFDIRRIRTTQVVNKERLNLIFHRLEVDFESGVGIDGDEDFDPQVSLSWSDDGGHTWSNQYYTSIGKIGEYEKRAVWRRLGMSRNRVFKLRTSSKVKIVILGAYAQIEECSA